MAKDECIPFGGAIIATFVTLHLVMAAPTSAPASSTDCGVSHMMIAAVVSCCVADDHFN
jgi:hypothetical protein